MNSITDIAKTAYDARDNVARPKAEQVGRKAVVTRGSYYLSPKQSIPKQCLCFNTKAQIPQYQKDTKLEEEALRSIIISIGSAIQAGIYLQPSFQWAYGVSKYYEWSK